MCLVEIPTITCEIVEVVEVIVVAVMVTKLSESCGSGVAEPSIKLK